MVRRPLVATCSRPLRVAETRSWLRPRMLIALAWPPLRCEVTEGRRAIASAIETSGRPAISSAETTSSMIGALRFDVDRVLDAAAEAGDDDLRRVGRIGVDRLLLVRLAARPDIRLAGGLDLPARARGPIGSPAGPALPIQASASGARTSRHTLILPQEAAERPVGHGHAHGCRMSAFVRSTCSGEVCKRMTRIARNILEPSRSEPPAQSPATLI